MFCTSCGKKIDDNLSFCIYCGKPVQKTSAKGHTAPIAEPQHGTSSKPQDEVVSASPSTASGTSATGQPPIQNTKTPSQTSVPIQHDASTPKTKPGKRRKLAIGVIAAAVIVIAAVVLIVFFAFGSKPCYRIASQTYYDTSGGTTNDLRYQYFENGAPEQYTFTHKESTTTTNYSLIGDGVSIPDSDTGTFQTNSDGDVITFSTISADGKTKSVSNYEYFSPGIIKRHKASTTKTAANGSETTTTITREYDEDGWLIKTDYVGETNSTEYYSYDFAADGKSATRYAFSDQALTQKKSTYRFVIDENGCVTEMYGIYGNGDEKLYSQLTYKKIEHPDKFPIALGRLKN